MIPNPFNLPGPEFLLVFILWIAVLYGLARLVLAHIEDGDPCEDRKLRTAIAQDPYQVAALRGGRDEVIRVAVVSLLDRNLLISDGRHLQASTEDGVNKVRRHLERAILSKFAKASLPFYLFTDPVIRGEANAFVSDVTDGHQLRPDKTCKFRRFYLFLAAECFLAGVGVTKILVALARGRHNVGFLVALILIGTVALAHSFFRSRTSRGDRILTQLQDLFARLKTRAAIPSASLLHVEGDITFLAAAFGLAALPVTQRLQLRALNLLPPPNASSGGDSSCFSSSCGSGSSSCSSGSSSCSGGSSCGGGGGCGGCGGGD